MANCDVCIKSLGEKEGYLLTTKQIVSTPAYWKKLGSHGTYSELMKAFGSSLDNPQVKQQLATMSASQKNPWVVCNECINLFSVDKEQTRELALRWYESGGTFAPPGSGPVSVKEVKMEEDSGSACFIATAAYGSSFAKEVLAFRRFRDSVLLKTNIGKIFVDIYYFFSPPIALIISKNNFLKFLVKCALSPSSLLVRAYLWLKNEP